MCRFTLYLGPSVRLATLLTEPSHSLIHQSIHAAEREEPLNGDGFGVGWYAPRLAVEPAVFQSVSPAWNNRNLRSIARVVTSSCVLAHVRAASAGSDVDLANCHPFVFRHHLLMHNGTVGAFRRVRRRLLADVADEAFGIVKGSTDTEHLFAVFVDELLRTGNDRQADSDPAFHLATVLSSTIARVLATVRAVGGGEPSFLNVAVADGAHAAVTRFTDSTADAPDSLYYLQGELYRPTAKDFDRRAEREPGEAVVVSSERLTSDPGWRAIPANHVIVLSRRSGPRLFALDQDGGILSNA